MSITLNNQHAFTHDDDPGRLISELHAWGIDYLVGGSHTVNAKEHLPAVVLVKRPYINLDPQKFADRHAMVRQELQQLS